MTAELSSQVNGTLKLLQLTDTHFFKESSGKLLGVDTASTFAEVFKLASVRQGTPEFYLLTGDLSQDATDESYRRLALAMQAAGAPCYYVPGNHDRCAEMTRGLLSSDSPFRSERQVIKGNWQIILLDTHIEGKVGGHLTGKELEFLKTCLAEHRDLFALVCLHHHPVAMGARWLDQIGLDNGDEFLKILSGFETARAVLWGHVHQEFDCIYEGLTMMATPSTCVQVKARTDEFCLDAAAPGYRWLELEPSGIIRSAVVRTEKFAPGLELSSAGY